MISTDLRAPYVGLGTHPDWCPQFVKAISAAAVHRKLESKLVPAFGPLIVHYSKIMPDAAELIQLSGFDRPTVCVISSTGEHATTPWMIIHNVGHTLLSWRVDIKRSVVKLLGLSETAYSVVANQAELVDCASSRRGLIPNLNELIYELFTTWVWSEHTKSSHKNLATFCDKVFAEAVASRRGKVFWHCYRSPTLAVETPVDWLMSILS